MKTIRIDRAGRLVIPQPIREKYGLVDGSRRLEIIESPEGIVLRPVAEDILVERHASGWVVFRSGREEAIEPDGVIEEERERRRRRIRGEE